MGLGVLDVLGSISGGLNASRANNQRMALQRGKATDAERKRKEEDRKRLANAELAALQSLQDGPEKQAAIAKFHAKQLQSLTPADGDAGGDIVSDIASIHETVAERVAKEKEEADQIAELDSFVDSAQGRKFDAATREHGTTALTEEGRYVTEGEAEMLGQAGQAGTGLDAIMEVNRQRDLEIESSIGKDGTKVVKERNKIADKIGSLRDEEEAIALRNRANDMNAQDLVVEIDERIERGFGGGGGDGALSKEQQKRQATFKVLKNGIGATREFLKNKSVQDVIGGTTGTYNRFRQENPIISGAIQTFSGTEIPGEFTVMQGLLSGVAEKYLRMLTGAAAQKEEIVRIAKNIVGDVTLNPETLNKLLQTFELTIEQELDVLEGRGDNYSPEEAAVKLFNIVNSSLNEGNDVTQQSVSDISLTPDEKRLKEIQEAKRLRGL